MQVIFIASSSSVGGWLSGRNDRAGHPVRFIDAFVEHIELERLGFQPRAIKQEGRPGFEARLFLKIYLYGYLNGIRSSRR
ncbi:MAG: hypothetical protein U0T77_12580 [Chitinophagales bacterium]